MKYSMMAAALLTLFVSIDAAALPTQRLLLVGIQTVLRNATDFCNRNQNVCREILVPEAIPGHHQKDLLPAGAFCKAAVALRSVKTEERRLNFTLVRLADTLIINGLKLHHGKPVKCSMDEPVMIDEEIELGKFLETLLKFSQRLYKKLADIAGQHGKMNQDFEVIPLQQVTESPQRHIHTPTPELGCLKKPKRS